MLKKKVLPVSWRAFYVKLQKRPKEKSKKMLFTVAIILFGLLLISVFFGQQKLREGQQTQKTADFLQQAQRRLEEGEGLIELNPVRAKQLLLEAQDWLRQAETQDGVDDNLITLKQRLDTLLPQVLREHEIQLEVFFDLVLIKDGAVATDVALAGDQLLVLDAAKKAVYQLGLANKQSTIVSGGEILADGRQISVVGEQILVATDQGLVKASKKASLLIDEPIEVLDLQSFGSNLYLLTSEGVDYFPALETETGFGDQRSWLKQTAGFSQPVSMAIDGSIWVLQADGRIFKFTRGQKEIFGMAGLDKSLLEPKAIFTDEDQENLYILDSGNRRIVVLEKSGEYHSQYSGEELSQATDLFVSEEIGKIFILDQNRIYNFEIK